MRLPRISRWALAVAAPATALSLLSAPAAAEEAPEARLVDITPMVMAALDEEGGASMEAAPAAAADLYKGNPKYAFNVSTVKSAKFGSVTLQLRRGLVTRSSSSDVPIAWARTTGGGNGKRVSIMVYNSSGAHVATDGRIINGTSYSQGFQIRSGYKYKACLSDTDVGCDNSVSKVL